MKKIIPVIIVVVIAAVVLIDTQRQTTEFCTDRVTAMSRMLRIQVQLQELVLTICQI